MPAEKKAIVDELRLAEKTRAERVRQDKRLGQWVKQLRQTYIADGFLMPLYARDGRYSQSQQRIREWGDFILLDEMVGEVFHRGAQERWIHQEDTWFWVYLINGQEYIFTEPIDSLPEPLRIDGTPAEPVWNILTNSARQMGLYGEDGGGVMISADDLDEKYLARMVPQQNDYEGENGFLEPYRIGDVPYWVTLFYQYEELEYAKSDIERRPAWFHLANYAFFNIPVTRLPVFLGVFENGKISTIRFLDECLSDRARDFISKALLGMPIELKKRLDTKTLRYERQEMTWWLWHNVGRRQYRRKLSYGQIANITQVQRSSIQSAVGRFDRKLRDKLDGKLLERLLHTYHSLGLGYNMTYQTLVRQGLAPPRERGIDSFDELDKLL